MTAKTPHEELRRILDEHAKWYIRRTIKLLEEGKEPSFVTATNEQDELSLQLIEAEATRRELAARADEIGRICAEVGLFTKKRNKYVYLVHLPIQYLTDRVNKIKAERQALSKK